MEYELKPTHFFLEQIDELSENAKRIVDNKLQLVKQKNRRV